MINRLQWRRQFLLTRVQQPALSSWNYHELAPYHLYTHPDLDVVECTGPGRQLVLLGYLFDPWHYERTNSEILTDIAGKASSFPALIEALKPCGGRYALLFRNSSDLLLVQDALSLRELYYCTNANDVICGSQPGLLRHFSSPALELSEDPDVVDFREHDRKGVRGGRLWVGDGTRYQGIKHLLPNHYFDVEARCARRYWPHDTLQALSLDAAAERACCFLRGMLRAITHRHSVMMAVTAGVDSRTLLAASRDVQDRIYYFINFEEHLTDKRDIRVPTRMFNDLGIPFHVHQISGEVDPEFRRLFLANTDLASEKILRTIYSVYHRNHPDKVNVLGVGEIGRGYYGKEPKRLDGYYLAHLLSYRHSKYATKHCGVWLDEVRGIARTHGVDVMALFLWEQLLGNWGAVGNSESDIAIEECDPYDSHYMYETLLAVEDRAVGRDRHAIFEEMIRRMWPDLLDYPFNPPETPAEAVKVILKKYGIYGILKNLKYQWNRCRYADQ